MKIIIAILFLLLSSCHMGKYYAHQRQGGKTKEEKIIVAEKPMENVTSESKRFQNMAHLTEINNQDTFSFVSEATSKIEIKTDKSEIHHLQNSLIVKNETKKGSKKGSKKVKHQKIQRKKINVFKSSPMKGLDSYWAKVIFWALILGLIVFFLSNSLGLGFLTALLILLAGLVVLAIVTAIVIWLLVEFFVLILEGV